MKTKQYSSGTIAIEFEPEDQVGLFKEMNYGIVIELPRELADTLLGELYRLLHPPRE